MASSEATKAEPVLVQIRWVTKRDLDHIVEIEEQSFNFPWSPKDFITVLSATNSIGLVAEYEGQIVGYMLYELATKSIRLLNMATAPEFRRREVGAQLIRRLKRKLGVDRRKRITAIVNESSLSAQLFLRAMEFRCVSVIDRPYEETDHDGYLFEYRLDQSPL